MFKLILTFFRCFLYFYYYLLNIYYYYFYCLFKYFFIIFIYIFLLFSSFVSFFGSFVSILFCPEFRLTGILKSVERVLCKRTCTCWSFLVCAFSRLTLHRRQNNSQSLSWLWGGLWSEGAAGGRVRVMRVMDGDTADHIGPLTCARAVERKPINNRWCHFTEMSKRENLTTRQGISSRPHPRSHCGWWWCWRQDWACQRWRWAETGHQRMKTCCAQLMWLTTPVWRENKGFFRSFCDVCKEQQYK